jgi:hypothetical protein
MASSVYAGDDWGLDGTPKWWWKYVLPPPTELYGHILSELGRIEGPPPALWLKNATGTMMEGLVMFHAAVRMGEIDGAMLLKAEAFAHISRAVSQLGSEGGFIGGDHSGRSVAPVPPPVGPGELRSA